MFKNKIKKIKILIFQSIFSANFLVFSKISHFWGAHSRLFLDLDR